MYQEPSQDAPPITLEYFKSLMGPYGLYQHATLHEPNLAEGYCTDDNARAVQVLLHLKHLQAADVAIIDFLLERCWQFLQQAQTPDGHFWNFRDAAGQWLKHGRTGDMIARVVRALVTVLTHDTHTTRQKQAAIMLDRLLPQVTTLNAPRSWAEVVIALSALPARYHDRYTSAALTKTGMNFLETLWHQHATDQWPWFEDQLTYANAILPHGILKGAAQEKTILEKSTRFLVETTIRNTLFTPVGNHGWYTKGGVFPLYDQQPIEAATMTDFFVDYMHVFPQSFTFETLAAPYLWFFGANTQNAAMVNVSIGACCDGLNIPGRNLNCGAESLLAYLWAEIRMRQALPAIQRYAWAKQKELLSKMAGAKFPT